MFPDMDKLEKTIDRTIAYINTLKSENESLRKKVSELEDAQGKAKEIIDRIMEKIQQIIQG